jgi:hypothetical protein
MSNVPHASDGAEPHDDDRFDNDSDDDIDALLSTPQDMDMSDEERDENEEQHPSPHNRRKRKTADASSAVGPQRNLLLRYGVAHMRNLRDAMAEEFRPSEHEPRCVAGSLLEMLSMHGDRARKEALGGSPSALALAPASTPQRTCASPRDPAEGGVTQEEEGAGVDADANEGATVPVSSLEMLMELRAAWLRRCTDPKGRAAPAPLAPPAKEQPQRGGVGADVGSDTAAAARANLAAMEAAMVMPLSVVDMVDVILVFFFEDYGDEVANADLGLRHVASISGVGSIGSIDDDDLSWAGSADNSDFDADDLPEDVARVRRRRRWIKATLASGGGGSKGPPPVTSRALPAMLSFEDRAAALARLFDAIDTRRSGGVSWSEFFAFLLESSMLGRVGKRFTQRKEFEVAYSIHGSSAYGRTRAVSAAVNAKSKSEHVGGARVHSATGKDGGGVVTSRRKKNDPVPAEPQYKSLADIPTGAKLDAEPGAASSALGGPIVAVEAIDTRGVVLLASTRTVVLVKAADPALAVKYAMPIDVHELTGEPSHKVLTATFLDRFSLVAVSFADSTVAFYFIAALTPRPVGAIQCPDGNATAVCWFPRRETFFVGARTGVVTAFSVSYQPANGLVTKRVKSVAAHKDMITGINAMPTESSIVVTSYDRTLCVLDVKTLRIMQVCEGHKSAVTAALHCPDFNVVVSGSYDPELFVWHISVVKKIPLVLTDAGKGHTGAVTALQEIGPLRAVASLDERGTLKLWCMRFFVCLQTFAANLALPALHAHHFIGMTLHTEPATAIDPIGTTRLTIFTRHTGCLVVEYNYSQKRVPTKNTADDDPLVEVFAHPASRSPTTVSHGQLKVWDVISSSVRDVFRNPELHGNANITCAQVEPTAAGLCVIGTRSGAVAVHSLHSGGVIARADDAGVAPGAAITCVCWVRMASSGTGGLSESDAARDASTERRASTARHDDDRPTTSNVDAAWYIAVASGMSVTVLELLPERRGLKRLEMELRMDGVIRSMAAAPTPGLVLVGDDTGTVSVVNMTVLLVSSTLTAYHAVAARLLLPLKPLAARDISCVHVCDELQLAAIADDDGQIALATLKPLRQPPSNLGLSAAQAKLQRWLYRLPRTAVVATWLNPVQAGASVARAVMSMRFGEPEFTPRRGSDAVTADVDVDLRENLSLPLYCGDDAGYVTIFDLGPSILNAVVDERVASKEFNSAGLLARPAYLYDDAFVIFPDQRMVELHKEALQKLESDETPLCAFAAVVNEQRLPRIINRFRAHADAVTCITLVDFGAGDEAGSSMIRRRPSDGAMHERPVSVASYVRAAKALVTGSADQGCYVWSTAGSRFLGAYDQYRRLPVRWPTNAADSGDATRFDCGSHDREVAEEARASRLATFRKVVEAARQSSERALTIKRVMTMTAEQRRSLVIERVRSRIQDKQEKAKQQRLQQLDAPRPEGQSRRSSVAVPAAPTEAAQLTATAGQSELTQPPKDAKQGRGAGAAADSLRAAARSVGRRPSVAAVYEEDANWQAERVPVEVPTATLWLPPPSLKGDAAAVCRPFLSTSPKAATSKTGVARRVSVAPGQQQQTLLPVVSFANLPRTESTVMRPGWSDDDEDGSTAIPFGDTITPWRRLSLMGGDVDALPHTRDLPTRAALDPWRRRRGYYALPPSSGSLAAPGSGIGFSTSTGAPAQLAVLVLAEQALAAAAGATSPGKVRSPHAAGGDASAESPQRFAVRRPKRVMSKEERLRDHLLNASRPLFPPDILPPPPSTGGGGASASATDSPQSRRLLDAPLPPRPLSTSSPSRPLSRGRHGEALLPPAQSQIGHPVFAIGAAPGGYGDDSDSDGTPAASPLQPPRTPRALQRQRASFLAAESLTIPLLRRPSTPLQYDVSAGFGGGASLISPSAAHGARGAPCRTSVDLHDVSLSSALILVPPVTVSPPLQPPFATRASVVGELRLPLAAPQQPQRAMSAQAQRILASAKAVGKCLEGLNKVTVVPESIAIRPASAYGAPVSGTATAAGGLPKASLSALLPMEELEWTQGGHGRHPHSTHVSPSRKLPPRPTSTQLLRPTPYEEHIAEVSQQHQRRAELMLAALPAVADAQRLCVQPTDLDVLLATSAAQAPSAAIARRLQDASRRCGSAAGRRVTRVMAEARAADARIETVTRRTGSSGTASTDAGRGALPARPTPLSLRPKSSAADRHR